MDVGLAEELWLSMFPRIWKILGTKQRDQLAAESNAFMCSGTHIVQKDCLPSALNTFVEAVTRCDPPIQIRPMALKYLGKSHNLWHRVALQLEQIAFDGNGSHSNPTPTSSKKSSSADHDHSDSGHLSLKPQQEAMDALSELYSLLREEDMWAGLWQKKAKYPETNIAIAYEQQGFFEQSQGAYELAMTKYRNDYSAGHPSPMSIQQEVKLWEEHWLRGSRELNQWETLAEYANTKDGANPSIILESAWRLPNWNTMKESLNLVELGYPRESSWRINLYRGYLSICHPDEPHLTMVERYVEQASTLCMKEWRRLPHVVSHVHLPYLQAAQQVMELQEACQIHQGLLHGKQGWMDDSSSVDRIQSQIIGWIVDWPKFVKM